MLSIVGFALGLIGVLCMGVLPPLWIAAIAMGCLANQAARPHVLARWAIVLGIGGAALGLLRLLSGG